MAKTFTIQEIKNYILSQESRGDILYYLTEANIEKANKPKEIEIEDIDITNIEDYDDGDNEWN